MVYEGQFHLKRAGTSRSFKFSPLNMATTDHIIILDLHALAATFLGSVAEIADSDVQEPPNGDNTNCQLDWQDDTIDLTTLQKLVIANCRLKEIDWSRVTANGIYLSVVCYLNVSFNKLSDVFFVRNLSSLLYLDLSHNKIKSLSSLKGNCSRLKQLRINNNEIEQLIE